MKYKNRMSERGEDGINLRQEIKIIEWEIDWTTDVQQKNKRDEETAPHLLKFTVEGISIF